VATNYDLTITLMQGETQIATQTSTNLQNTSYVDRVLTLSEAERDSITDFDDLQVYVKANITQEQKTFEATVEVRRVRVVFT
jgi:hypothetical protein